MLGLRVVQGIMDVGMRNKENKIDTVQQYKNLSDVIILTEHSDEGSRARTLQETFARLPLRRPKGYFALLRMTQDVLDNSKEKLTIYRYEDKEV